MDFLTKMKEQAKKDKQTIVLPEGSEKRTIAAVGKALEEGLADLILLGKKDEILKEAAAQGVDISKAKIVEPEKDEHYEDFWKTFYEMRKAKGVTEEQAKETMKNEIYFGTMMVEKGIAGGLVSGAIHSTGDTMRPALQILKTAPAPNMCLPLWFCRFRTASLATKAPSSSAILPSRRIPTRITWRKSRSHRQILSDHVPEGTPESPCSLTPPMAPPKARSWKSAKRGGSLPKKERPSLISTAKCRRTRPSSKRSASSKPRAARSQASERLVFPDLNAANIAISW